MHNGKYVSIKSVFSELLRYPFMEGIQPEDVALHLTNLLSLLGSPFAFSKKIESLNVENNRVKIPCDLIRIEGIRLNDCDGNKPLRYASDLFHSAIHCDDSPDLSCNSDLTYSINNNLIYTSFKEGVIQIAYESIVTDEEGFPMIPDLAEVKQALKYYILWQYAEPSYYRGEVTRNVYEDIKQEYAWYIGSASNKLNMLSLDKAKTLENGLIRLFQSVDFHNTSWKSFSKKEIFNK